MIGKIEQASRSKSGKTLGLKIDGTWYITKEWELENMVGTAIDFAPKIDTYQGKPQRWINEYFLAGDAPPAAERGTAPTARVTSLPATDNVALLNFVGLMIAGVPASDWDEVGRKAYAFGKGILSGRMDAVSTAAKPPEYADRNQDDHAGEDDFDDDIPF